MKSVLQHLFVSVIVCFGALGAEAEGVNVWGHGTFDDPADSRPPRGWLMWGDPKHKNPANYTVDTQNPHAGAGSFRLVQPAGTDGYINMDPALAVRPKRGMMYTVTFWARAQGASPVESKLVVEGYASDALEGWKDVAQKTFKPTAEWQSVSLTLREGWDFFVGRENLLMMALRPSGRVSDGNTTLWIDDFSVIERPSDREGRLIDPASVKAEPLDPRLRPGDELRVTVDAGKRLRRIEEAVGGVSFHRVSGWMGLPYDRQGVYSLPKVQEDAIRELKLPMTRFYAVGDESYSLEDSIDKAAAVCRKVGVPLENVVLEFEIQDASKTLPPEVWVRGVKHSLDQGYGFCHWEVSNEPYVFGTTAFPEKDSYLRHFIAVSQAIRAVQPQAKIGIALWADDLLQSAAGHYDFVVKHHYVFHPSTMTGSFEDIVLGANYDKLGDILQLNALMAAFNPGRTVFQYDTEWGMHSDGPNGAGHNNRNANIIGTLHRAVRLLHYAREGMLKGASSWEMFSPEPKEGYTFGFIPKDAPGKFYMFYWLYYCFNRHVGEWALATEGTAPWYKPADGVFTQRDASGPLTPFMASLDSSGQLLYVIAVNGSWEKSVRCELSLKHFTASQATGVFLSSDDRDASPLVEKKEDFVKTLPVSIEGEKVKCELPPHSAVFITLSRGSL